MGPEALWFFGGALTFQILSRLFKAGQLVRLSQETVASLLVLAEGADVDMRKAMEIKYKKLTDSGIKDEELELIKEIDANALSSWRNAVIFKFKSGVPMPLRGTLKFEDWDSAMNFMKKNIKF